MTLDKHFSRCVTGACCSSCASCVRALFVIVRCLFPLPTKIWSVVACGLFLSMGYSHAADDLVAAENVVFEDRSFSQSGSNVLSGNEVVQSSSSASSALSDVTVEATTPYADANAVVQEPSSIGQADQALFNSGSPSVASQEHTQLLKGLRSEHEQEIEQQGEKVLVDSDFHKELPNGMHRQQREAQEMRQAANLDRDSALTILSAADPDMQLQQMQLQAKIFDDLIDDPEVEISRVSFSNVGLRYEFILQHAQELAQIVTASTPHLDLEALHPRALSAIDLPDIFNNVALPRLFETKSEILARYSPLPSLFFEQQERGSRASMMLQNPLLSPYAFVFEDDVTDDADWKHALVRPPFALQTNESGDKERYLESHSSIDGLNVMLAEQVKVLQTVAPDIERLSQRQELFAANQVFMPPPRERPRKGSILQEDLKQRQELYRSGMSAQMWLKRRGDIKVDPVQDESGYTFADDVGDVIYYSQRYLSQHYDKAMQGILIVGTEDMEVQEAQKSSAKHDRLLERSRWLQKRHLQSDLFTPEPVEPESQV